MLKGMNEINTMLTYISLIKNVLATMSESDEKTNAVKALDTLRSRVIDLAFKNQS